MLYLVYAIHVIICLFLILVVLLQQGKGADLSVFGGGSTQAAFGARGPTIGDIRPSAAGASTSSSTPRVFPPASRPAVERAVGAVFLHAVLRAHEPDEPRFLWVHTQPVFLTKVYVSYYVSII